MSSEIRVPQTNVNDEFAMLLNWTKDHGESVNAGEPVAEMETSKAVFDVCAENSGILAHEREVGKEVLMGDVIGVILDEDEFEAWERRKEAASGELSQAATPVAPLGAVSADPASTPSAAGEQCRLRATPSARRLATSLGIDLARIQTPGVVRESDVLSHLRSATSQPETAMRQAKGQVAWRHPEPPIDLIEEWKVLDPEQQAGGWLLYSREFLTRILSGGYGGATRARSIFIRIGVNFAMACTAVAQIVVWVFAKIPIISTWLEIIARIYKRNKFGFFLRGAYYKARLSSMGPDNIIDQNVEIWGPSHVTVGRGCHLDMYARLAAGEESEGQKGTIEIGDYVHIGPQTQLAGRGGISIGSYTAITAGTKIFSATNVGDNPDDPTDLLPMSHAAPLDRQRVFEAPVRIADHVFVGLNVCILPGVSIGRGAIINSGAVVTGDVPDFAIVGGNPTRIQGYRVPRSHRPASGKDQRDVTKSSGNH